MPDATIPVLRQLNLALDGAANLPPELRDSLLLYLQQWAEPAEQIEVAQALRSTHGQLPTLLDYEAHARLAANEPVVALELIERRQRRNTTIASQGLEARALLVTRHGGGTHVADVTGQIFAPPVADLIATHRKARADYLEYRREIEGTAAEFAARRATGDDRALLSAIMRRMEQAHARGDFDEEASIDVEFHNAICECAHNIVLLHTLRSCYRLLADGVFLSRTLIYRQPGAQDELLAQHRAIFDAVVGGDPDAARRAARVHIDYVEHAMIDAEREGEWQRISRLRLSQRERQASMDGSPAREPQDAN